jgi:hypothetical protein
MERIGKHSYEVWLQYLDKVVKDSCFQLFGTLQFYNSFFDSKNCLQVAQDLKIKFDKIWLESYLTYMSLNNWKFFLPSHVFLMVDLFWKKLFIDPTYYIFKPLEFPSKKSYINYSREIEIEWFSHVESTYSYYQPWIYKWLEMYDVSTISVVNTRLMYDYILSNIQINKIEQLFSVLRNVLKLEKIVVINWKNTYLRYEYNYRKKVEFVKIWNDVYSDKYWDEELNIWLWYLANYLNIPINEFICEIKKTKQNFLSIKND